MALHARSGFCTSGVPVIEGCSRYTVILYDGVRYDPWSPEGPAPSPETIAWGLANLNRYGGHTSRPLSVAEHSIWIALHIACGGSDNELFQYAADALAGNNLNWLSVFKTVPHIRVTQSLFGLIHDTAEGAGLVDVPSPVGRHAAMIPYKDAHDRCTVWLCNAWGVQPPPWPSIVKEIDHAVLGAEMAIRPSVKLSNGDYVPPWPNLDLAGKHDLSLLSTKYIREAWVSAFYTLRNLATCDLVEESTGRLTIAANVPLKELK